MADTYLLFEDAGKFLAGRVMSEAESSMQVELDSGKRVKVKSTQALMRFGAPAPALLLDEAQAQSADIDLDLAWETAPDEDFGFDDIAREYFGAQADASQRAATLFKLHQAPHYFHRRGKGRFRKAPQEVLEQALRAIERKAEQARQIDAWAAELAAGGCPEPIAQQLYKILFKPDKNGPEYKAVVAAAKLAHKAPLDLLKDAGAITSPYQFHWRRFLFEFFPKGTAFAPMAAPAIKDELPLAAVRAFSIDDSTTTEIDDALSVQGLGSATVTFGIHIAAPALAFAPGSPVDQLARARLSTVYMPGHKLTMLPDAVVQTYTLQAGRDCPAVSVYFDLDAATLAVTGTRTALERVPIVANLRHDQLDGVVTEATLDGDAEAGYEFAGELAFAHRLARHLKAQREVARGKPENFTRPDYAFKLEGRADEKAGDEPDGSETVVITERKRGSALDLIVAEAMILANSHWGGWLAEHGVPGIYRSQASMAPGVKVRMGTKPAPHAGMGVRQYTWATSPLRRYVDLVNQWQIVAVARHGRSAALAAPFKPKDAELFSVISSFDAAYTAYNQFQNAIERFWAMRHLQQAGVAELDAAVMKDGLVRAHTLPLVFRALGTESLPRGAKVRVRVTGLDLLTLDVHASLAARLDDQAAAAASDEESDDEAEAATPLALAIDVADAEAPGAEPATASGPAA
ncbi:MAG TPA: ribonuclease catalytic domain-containing protein [Methylibium sp.]|uniref:ribonuclease catalytic domain-containing protein n=1 Tax=Methylibium sp. TaxID=2067992 RepID=UPI002DB87900|nr:ribonuclease catalytic domain-containing protein [Methylibium sp.]HEU4457939.1 ribonuclease catalytic domain-containing protein [Methylibium sp.]